MSGWVHNCANGNQMIVEHGDMSGYVRIREMKDGRPEYTISIPGCDILKLVANFARSEQFTLAERFIDRKSDCEVLGIERMPGLPCDLQESDDGE